MLSGILDDNHMHRYTLEKTEFLLHRYQKDGNHFVHLQLMPNAYDHTHALKAVFLQQQEVMCVLPARLSDIVLEMFSSLLFPYNLSLPLYTFELCCHIECNKWPKE